MPTPHSRQQFQEPTPSATPHERRMFAVLVVLGCVVVFLIWIWTLPFNFRRVEEGPAGPRQFFNVLGDQVSTALRAYQSAGNNDEEASANSSTIDAETTSTINGEESGGADEADPTDTTDKKTE